MLLYTTDFIDKGCRTSMIKVINVILWTPNNIDNGYCTPMTPLIMVIVHP